MKARKKKPDAFAQFDQARHALALREIAMQRALLAVYRYALEHDKLAWPRRDDRKLCQQVKGAAESDLSALDAECPCWRDCCEHGEDKSNLREVIDACEHVLDEMEPRP